MLQVNSDRLRTDLEALARFGANAHGGIDRATFSQPDTEARRWFAQRCSAAGLRVTEDGIGNLFARLDGGQQRAQPPVWTGSHLDAVPNGGRFDGAAGVLSALEAVRRLAEERVVLHRPVEVVVWSDEEGCYQGLLGSTAVTEGLTEADLDRVGRDGRTLRQALLDSGRHPTAALAVAQPPGAAHAYVELHIEQGTVLETSDTEVGVVSTIVGFAHGQVTFRGRADHAGTTPMDRRRDALVGAGAFVARLPGVAGQVGAAEAVVTCGRVQVAPGADNIVPAEASCRLDFRARDGGTVQRMEEAIVTLARACADEHELAVDYAREHLADPVPLDARIRSRVEAAAKQLGYRHCVLPSGAGHDAQKIARIAPAGMIFVPSRAGRSHSPAEHTEWDALARGADVLLGVVRDLATA